jgi:hypothetical protein
VGKVVAIRQEDGFNLPALNQEDGTSYGWFDRWNVGTTPDGKYLTDYSDWEARDMHEMLKKDYKAKQIENVLTLPISSAEYSIEPAKGDTGEAEWLKAFWEADNLSGGCATSLDQILGLMTSAFYYRRAYFEKVFAKGTGQFEGKYIYSDVCWRPQTTCRLMRDPRNGRFMGFEQEPYYVGAGLVNGSKWPIQIPVNRAFVYTHGTRRDPLNGTSDMEVAYWAWKTKQKVLLLWFQFLQSVALPRVVVKSNDLDTSKGVAREIARLKNSGVLPVSAPGGPDSVDITPMDISGKGSEQFKAVVDWLDQCATQSVLAGFLDLTSQAANGTGSYALSENASDFFLQSLETKTKEIADQTRQQLFAPLIYANFGRDAAVPYLHFEPLNDIDKSTAIDLLKTSMAAPPGGPVPTSFIAGLASQVAKYLGMDSEETRDAFKKSFDAAAAQAQAKALAESPGGGSPVGQAVAGVSGAVAAAKAAVDAGLQPKKVLKDAKKAAAKDGALHEGHNKRVNDMQATLAKHAERVVHAKTDGAAAL